MLYSDYVLTALFVLSFFCSLTINKFRSYRSFSTDIPEDEDGVAIVKAMIALEVSLNLDLLPEGVETSEQRNFLMDHGCINIQGHYYSHPMPPEEIYETLLKNR